MWDCWIFPKAPGCTFYSSKICLLASAIPESFDRLILYFLKSLKGKVTKSEQKEAIFAHRVVQYKKQASQTQQ